MFGMQFLTQCLMGNNPISHRLSSSFVENLEYQDFAWFALSSAAEVSNTVHQALKRQYGWIFHSKSHTTAKFVLYGKYKLHERIAPVLRLLSMFRLGDRGNQS